MITTERLILRRFKKSDLADFTAYVRDRMSSEDVRYDMPWPTDSKGIKATLRFFSKNDAWFAVQLRSGPVIGFVVADRTKIEHIRSLGYAIRSDYRKQGYVYEACSAVIAHCRGEGITGFTASTADCLEGSVRLLEKLGFVKTEVIADASLNTDAHGNPIHFTAGRYKLGAQE